MATVRLALANLPFPSTPADAITLAEQAILEAGVAGCAGTFGGHRVELPVNALAARSR